MNIVSKAEQFLQQRFAYQTREKAKRIMYGNNIHHFKYSEDDGTIQAMVFSETKAFEEYHVVFTDLNAIAFNNATCKCIDYKKGQWCKHQAAVLLKFIKEFKLKNIDKPQLRLLNIPDSLEKCSDLVSADEMEKLLEQLLRKFYIRHVDKNEIVVTLSLKPVDDKFTFTIDEGKLQITSPSSLPEGELTANDFSVIKFLFEHCGKASIKEFLKSIDQQKKKLFIEAESLGQNYSENDFIYSLKNGELSLHYNGKDLISENQFNEILQLPFVVNESKSDFGFLKSNADTQSDAINYANGFIIDVKALTGFEREKFFSGAPLIAPLRGKLGKESNQLSSNISVMEAADFIFTPFVTDEQKNIVGRAAATANRIKEILKKAERDFESAAGLTYQAHKIYLSEYLEIFKMLQGEMLYIGSYAEKNTLASYRLQKTTTLPQPVTLHVEISFQKHFYVLNYKLKCGDIFYESDEAELFNGSVFYLQPNHLALAATPETVYYYHILSRIKNVKMRESQWQEFMNKSLLPMTEHIQLSFDSSIEVHKILFDENNCKKVLLLKDMDKNVLFYPAIRYDKHEILVKDNPGNMLIDENRIYSVERNEWIEQSFIDTIRDNHPSFREQHASGYFYLDGKQLLNNGWFIYFMETMRAMGVEVQGADSLGNLKYNTHKPTFKARISSGIDWFDVKIEVAFGTATVGVKELRKAIMRRDKFVTLSDGTTGILPEEWLERYSKYLMAGEVVDKGIQISKFQTHILRDFDPEFFDDDSMQELNDKIQLLNSFEKIHDVEVPSEVQATLRHYQEDGLKWLNFLDQHNWGGCLADDMGLGKTIQVLSFLLKQKNENNGCSLVIIPTSLIFNWQEEIAKFTPSLRYKVHYGPQRERKQIDISDTDLIITTYGHIINDVQLMAKHNFNYIILDESQAIKNTDSLRYKAVSMLRSRNKVVMTGTPIENNLTELYAQFNFLNRGMFGSLTSFREQFPLGVAEGFDVNSSDRLRKIIKPFLLRRTKEQVITELPGKTETILYCEMGEAQRKIYNTFKEHYREKILTGIESNGIGKSSMIILEAMLRMRQICNSPRLLKDQHDYGSESVKMNELVSSIKEKTGNHKILVFSQFVEMLNLIAKELDASNTNYEMLTGQTRNRGERVNNFQNNEECRVFLLSLKAGGVGLNLTAADYVFIVDPWWNPAVETQAIDRAYRIGQDKKVFAYRMICKNTIEEKVLKLQEGKKKLVSDIISEDNIYKSLSKEDILHLFD